MLSIYYTTKLPEEGLRRLAGFRTTSELSEAEVIVSTFDFPVRREMIERAPKLRLIANLGVGFNNIDLATCRERGIRVTNTPDPVIEPTAELAFALMLALARKVSLFDRQLREGTAESMGVMHNLSHSLYGKTLGIIGMGNIGRSLARRAIASGMTVMYHNRHDLKVDYAKYVDQETLLKESDYVSLNLPYTPEVHHLIGAAELKKMKPTAYLINTARGAHVCETDLVEALRNGTIAGAALDVYETEPHISEALKSLDNIVLSPHTGTGTWEGRIAMCENVADNVLAFVAGDITKMNIVL